MAFFLKNTKKDINMTEKDEQDFKNNNSCRFCEKIIEPNKVRDLCHLTGKYRGPTHSFCNISVTQKQSSFIPFLFHDFIVYDCHMFFETSVDKKKDKVIFDSFPRKQTKNIYQ